MDVRWAQLSPRAVWARTGDLEVNEGPWYAYDKQHEENNDDRHPHHLREDEQPLIV